MTSLFRIFLLVSQPLAMGGDSEYYLRVADQILTTGELPEVDKIKANGFPLLLAGLQAAFGNRFLEALGTLQIAAELTLVASAQVLVLLLFRERPAVAFPAALVVGLQPFTSLFTRAVLSEPISMLFFSAGATCLVAALSPRRGRSRWLATCGSGAILGVAAIMRAETIVYVPFLLIAFGLLLGWTRRRCGESDKIAANVFIALIGVGLPIAALSAAQLTSTGSPILFRGGQFYSHGYYDWLRTWFGWETKHHNVLAFHTWGSDWRGWEMQSYPPRAFASPREQLEVKRLLNLAKAEGPEAVDEGFSELARGRRRDRPVLVFVGLPMLRMAHYWLNLEGGPVYFKALQLPSWMRKVVIALLLILRIVLFGLVCFGVAWAILRSRSEDFMERLLLMAIAAVVTRTVFLAAAGTVTAGGLMESRYVAIVWPFYLVASAAGLLPILDGRLSERAEPAPREHLPSRMKGNS